MLDKKFQLKCIGLVNTYRLIQKKIYHAHSNARKPTKTVGATVLGGLGAFHLRCAGISRIYILNPNIAAFIVTMA